MDINILNKDKSLLFQILDISKNGSVNLDDLINFFLKYKRLDSFEPVYQVIILNIIYINYII